MIPSSQFGTVAAVQSTPPEIPARQPAKRMWYSLYVYPDAPINEYFAKRLPECISQVGSALTGGYRQFFVVRYNDRFGPHLRLRFQLPASKPAVTLSGRSASRDGIVDNPAFLAGAGLKLAREVAYRAEVRRYGGARGLTASETQFHLSTQWVMANFEHLHADYKTRLKVAAICTAILLEIAYPGAADRRQVIENWLTGAIRHVGGPGNEVAYRKLLDTSWAQFATGWQQCFQAAAKFAQPGEPAADFLREWAATCRETVKTLDQSLPCSTRAAGRRAGVITSWAHMHNNRLGIAFPDEVLAAYAHTRHRN